MSLPAGSSKHDSPACAFNFQSCTGSNPPVWWCVDCSARICDACWAQIPGHRDGATARDGQPHERTDARRHDHLRKILNPPVSEDELEQLHEADMKTTWFGIGRNRYREPFLTDGGIYNTLMAECPNQDGTKYPQLVSFIGQTNAGKSTLIKMLIDREELQMATPQPLYATPVVGSSIHKRLPTSADVHLYADPKTYCSSKPLFYADAEGLDAGEETPMGASARRTSRRRGIRGGSKRILQWADTTERRERGFIVSELYPRLLYTFSDVVVFVLRNEKTFEKTGLERLIKWGAASLETSVNQPTLPQLIIAVNAATTNVATQQEWNVEYATRSLLEAAQTSLSRKNYFKSLARDWRDRGRRIDSVEDLIRCYYSSFSVVRIPAEGRYALLDRQIEALGDRITVSCKTSFESRRRANMLSNSDEFSMFLHSAFDHFTEDLQTPFNFIEVSLRNNPIQQNFGGCILQLAITLHDQDPEESGRWVFEVLSTFIASSMLLDCVRNRKGLPQDHIADYEDYLDYVLSEFCKFYSPCTFRNENGKCVNTRSAHIKGHQNSRGKIFATGPYKSDLTFDGYFETWADAIDRDIQKCQTKLETLRDQADPRDPTMSDEYHALRVHKKSMERFYRAAGTAKEFQSHTVCFSCLMGLPQHALPCGHVLCTPCIKGFGRPLNRFDISLNNCPLHSDDPWPEPCVVRFKPDLAGVRILSLDGGGVRGIVELEVLRAIQEAVGDKIPIQAFFDLIVGTSTGGVIALALGKNWTIRRCKNEFQTLCHQAFTPRELHGIPLLQRLATLNHGSMYKTKQLHQALQRALGDKSLFGGQLQNETDYTPKVAVTATDDGGRRAVVIANYNRPIAIAKGRSNTESQYDFPRPDNPSLELSFWQAAAATSAAPPYFKSFHHKATRRSYLDGAFYNNNPARVAQQERKLLWGEVADRHPDIFLSIGTSKDARQVERDMRQSKSSTASSSRRPIIPFPRWHQLFHAMHGRIDSILDAERSWKEFVNNTADVNTDENNYRYIRVNPDICCKPPRIDATDQLKSLSDAAVKALDGKKSTIQKISRMLISSSFYFDMITSPSIEASTGFKCTGRILCRLEGYLRPLGDYFLLQQRPGFQPYFEVSEDDYHRPRQQLYITSEIINRMRQQGSFDMGTFDMTLSSRNSRIHIVLFLVPVGSVSREPLSCPISGFPRTLASENASGWVPPTSSSGENIMKKTQKPRRKERRVRRSTGGIDFGHVDHFTLSNVSRSSSLPAEHKISSSGEEKWDFAAELHAPLTPARRLFRPTNDESVELSEKAGDSRQGQGTPGLASGRTHLPLQSKEMAQNQLREYIGTSTRPSLSSLEQDIRLEVNSQFKTRSILSELPAEDVSQKTPPGEQGSIQRGSARQLPITAPTRNMSTPLISSSRNEPAPKVKTRVDELRKARRMPSSRDLVPNSKERAETAINPPECTRRRAYVDSDGFVSSESPLSNLERRSKTAISRHGSNGYASKEDAESEISMGMTVPA